MTINGLTPTINGLARTSSIPHYLAMTLEEGFAHALDGNALLFLGAGFSQGATNIKGTGLKLGSELQSFLSNQAKAPEGSTLEDAAETYQRKFGQNALIQELVREFTVETVAPHHLAFARVPWMRIYTTNFDNAFELAAERVKQPIQSLTIDADPYTLHQKRTSCIHLNGYILDLSPETLISSFKLTETSYITSSIATSPWAVRLREDSCLARAVFFLGYSMFDLDVRRILADSPNLKSKCFFVLGDKPRDLLVQRVERYGQVISITVQTAGTRIDTFQATYRPPIRPPLVTNSFKEVAPIQTLRDPRDKDMLDLFELGLAPDDMISASLSRRILYYLHRTKLEKIVEWIETGTKAIAISGALGNGKTLLLKELELQALQHGYRVFKATTQTEHSPLECERIAKLDGKILLIVDNYQHWFKEISAFRQVDNERTRLVVSARDAVHDIVYERLEAECGLSSIPEININKLDQPEVDWFLRVLDQYGLWRSRAGASLREKEQLLKINYGCQIHGILLGLLESKDIGNRVLVLFKDVGKNKNFFEVVASIFILNTLNQPPSIEMLQDLWGPELISSTAFRENPIVCQLIDFSNWNVRVKSSIVSEFILRSSSTTDLVPILTKMCRHTATNSKYVPRYRALFNELVRFSSVQRILPEQGRLDGTIRYYESIKDLPPAQLNPLFWLQYAIGCLLGADLKRAKGYFDTAYSLADKRDFDTFQIDNHFARYLLIACTASNLTTEEAVANFREARSIINRQMQQERRHYPYRVATLYQDFLDKFGSKLSSEVCNELLSAAEYVLERIEELPEERAIHSDVRHCETTMRYVQERCQQLVSKGK